MRDITVIYSQIKGSISRDDLEWQIYAHWSRGNVPLLQLVSICRRTDEELDKDGK